MYKTYKLYKPYGFLSQFTKEHASHRVLGELYEFPNDIYPIGRLDRDSEGLLLLSNDKSLTKRILNPESKLPKEYFVQLEGEVTQQAIEQIRNGVRIKVKNGQYHTTLSCKSRVIPAPAIEERIPPIRYRKTVPTSWASITLMEGKNRQVRKMFAAVGFPVLRLVRYRVGKTTIDGMKLGEVQQLKDMPF